MMKSRLSSFLVGLPLTLVVVQPQAMETQNCDAVIIGAGGSGISAAITLKEAGKQHVCLVEKMPFLGGATNLAATYFTVVNTKEALQNT